MFKSIVAAIVALFAATFGAHYATGSPPPAHGAVQTAAAAISPTPNFHDGSGAGHSAQIEIVNDYFAAPTTLVAGARFETAGGDIFRSPQSVVVPGESGATSGTITISVAPDVAGQEPTGRLTLPGLAASPALYAHIYAIATTPRSATAQTASAASALDTPQQQYPAAGDDTPNSTTQQTTKLSSGQTLRKH
jgi:hypothetical protein